MGIFIDKINAKIKKINNLNFEKTYDKHKLIFDEIKKYLTIFNFYN